MAGAEKKKQRGAHGREEEAFACSGAKSEEQIRTGGQARKEGTGRRMVIGVHYLWWSHTLTHMAGVEKKHSEAHMDARRMLLHAAVQKARSR